MEGILCYSKYVKRGRTYIVSELHFNNPSGLSSALRISASSILSRLEGGIPLSRTRALSRDLSEKNIERASVAVVKVCACFLKEIISHIFKIIYEITWPSNFDTFFSKTKKGILFLGI